MKTNERLILKKFYNSKKKRYKINAINFYFQTDEVKTIENQTTK